MDNFQLGEFGEIGPGWENAKFPNFKIHPIQDFRSQLQTYIDSVLVENDKGISGLIKIKSIGAVKSGDEIIQKTGQELMSLVELNVLEKNLLSAVITKFNTDIGTNSSRQWITQFTPQYESAVTQIESEIKMKFKAFKTSHESRLFEWMKKNSDKAMNIYYDMKRTIEMSLLPADESVLELQHAKAIAGLVKTLDDELGASKFNDSNPYRETRERLDQIVSGEYEKLRKKNIELWKVHSDEATHCGIEANFRYAEEHCPQGWFCWFKVWPGAHRAKSAQHLLNCFKSARVVPPESVRTQVFDSWYEKELGKEVAEVRSNMWIAIVSLIVPIAWIFYIRYT